MCIYQFHSQGGKRAVVWWGEKVQVKISGDLQQVRRGEHPEGKNHIEELPLKEITKSLPKKFNFHTAVNMYVIKQIYDIHILYTIKIYIMASRFLGPARGGP